MKSQVKFTGAMKRAAETSASPHRTHMNQTTTAHVGAKQAAKLAAKSK